MVYDLTYIDILRVLTFIIGLISLIFGFYVIPRCSGKIKSVAIFLIITIMLLEIKKFIVLNMTDASSLPYRVWFDLGISIFFFFAAYTMKKMVEDFDRKHHHKIISSAQGTTAKQPQVEAYDQK